MPTANFDTASVRAILAGQKTTFRRPLTVQPLGRMNAKRKYKLGDVVIRFANQPHAGPTVYQGAKGDAAWVPVKRPCNPGDIVIGLEPWAVIRPNEIHYAADHITKISSGIQIETAFENQDPWMFRPPWDMPVHLARLKLRIKSVQCQRLWKIDEAAAVAEGMKWIALRHPPSPRRSPYRKLYARFWDDIVTHHANQGSSENQWAVNPWIWVVEFKLEKSK